MKMSGAMAEIGDALRPKPAAIAGSSARKPRNTAFGTKAAFGGSRVDDPLAGDLGRAIEAKQHDNLVLGETLVSFGLLKRHGLIDELDLMHMQGEKHFYERRPQRDHIHMACLRCGKIAEFESDLFDRLKGQIQRECQFHILVSRLEIGGYCAECRSSK